MEASALDEPFVIHEEWFHEWFEYGFDKMIYFLQLNAEFEEYCDKLEEISEQLEDVDEHTGT